MENWVWGRNLRFIPTCVGNACFENGLLFVIAVHPHVCGERVPMFLPASKTAGSSPRVWGTLFNILSQLYFSRFIPTCVGNANGHCFSPGLPAVHPHVCGERKYFPICRGFAVGSSPRVWGTPPATARSWTSGRFIPTCVGNALLLSY